MIGQLSLLLVPNMVLLKMNNHEHRTKQTYESYTFQPLMSLFYKSVVKIHLNLRERRQYGTMTKSYRQNLKAVAPCLTFTCKDSFPTAAGLAQSVERLTAERELLGSIPRSGPTLREMKVLTLHCKRLDVP